MGTRGIREFVFWICKGRMEEVIVSLFIFMQRFGEALSIFIREYECSSTLTENPKKNLIIIEKHTNSHLHVNPKEYHCNVIHFRVFSVFATFFSLSNFPFSKNPTEIQQKFVLRFYRI